MNLLEQQKHRSNMADCWHISVVKTHVRQNSYPHNDKHGTTRKQKPNHGPTDKATSGQRHIPNESYDFPVPHRDLGFGKEPSQTFILLATANKFTPPFLHVLLFSSRSFPVYFSFS